MAATASSGGAIGMLGYIETAAFRDWLEPEAIEKAPPGMGGSPVNLLCQELLRRGRRLVVFSLDPSVKTEYLICGEQLRIHFGPATNSASRFFADERRFLARAIATEDLSVLHAHWTYEFALAAIASGLPHVVTAHDAPVNCLRYKFGRPEVAAPFRGHCARARTAAYWLIRTLLAYKAARGAQQLVAVSPYVADHLRRYRLRAGQTAVIPNGLPRTPLARSPSRQPDGCITFATALSQWSGLKNGEAAIRAFAAVRGFLPDARMLMFGAGHAADGPAAAWARERGWDAGIEFHGLVPHGELMNLLSRRVDILVHPSLEEAFAMPLIEAMSLGIPVIGGETAGGVPWVLGGGQFGLLVDVRAPDEIAAAMLHLARDDVRRAALGAAGREAARQRFSIEKVADEYEAIYAELALRKSRGAASRPAVAPEISASRSEFDIAR